MGFGLGVLSILFRLLSRFTDQLDSENGFFWLNLLMSMQTKGSDLNKDYVHNVHTYLQFMLKAEIQTKTVLGNLYFTISKTMTKNEK